MLNWKMLKGDNMTKAEIGEVLNSPIVCAIMEGLCANPSLIGGNVDVNSINIINHFEKIMANLYLSIEKTGKRDDNVQSNN